MEQFTVNNKADSHVVSTIDGSYLHNCLIMRRIDDISDALFYIPADGLKMITKLDGYAIIPLGDYEKLISLTPYELRA